VEERKRAAVRIARLFVATKAPQQLADSLPPAGG
jgi:hypothetical protein